MSGGGEFSRSLARVLVVDSPGSERHGVEAELRSLGYDVSAADSGADAVRILRQQKIACALVSAGLTDVAAPDLVPSIRQAEPDVGLVVLAADNDAELAVRCLHQGATDCLVRPIARTTLDRAIQYALERRRALMADVETHRLLQAEVAALTLEVRRERMAAARSSVFALESLVHMMEVRDPFLAGHSVRVAQIAATMAAELGRNDEEIEAVREAGRLHDIGMLCVGDGIISKKGPLTEEEFSHVKQHVVIGSEVVGRLPGLELVSGAIRGHHERWDGRGYPDGLSQESIPWPARLIGTAEIYDALTTSRPYREATTATEAVSQMRALVGSVLSPDSFEALATIVERKRALVFIDGGRDEMMRSSLEREAVLEGRPIM
ncbi:MAG: HD-GYP domain-containing protein [Gemmatimonadales bacterium]